MKLRNAIDEIIGWCGTVAILLAYSLSSFEVLSSQSLIYNLLNAAGAIGITYVSFKKKAYQPGVLNVIWTVIAIIAIARI